VLRFACSEKAMASLLPSLAKHALRYQTRQARLAGARDAFDEAVVVYL
jgi:hypothetical protein